MISEETQTVTPQQLADKWGMKVDTLLKLIHTGQLLAFNVAIDVHKRPRWKITLNEVARFELSRTAQPPALEKQRLNRRKKPAASHREFF